jgi:dephospho-CoA kinase
LKSQHGIPIIDADALARQVVEPGTRAYSKIVSHFGQDVVQLDGALDRTKLGEIIFNDSAKRKTLNEIVHPAVSRAMIIQILKCWLGGHKICVLDVPLLIEAGIWKWVGCVAVVYWQVY